jgi:hypothetical protein
MAVHADGRPDGWRARFPDWPRDALEIGQWRVVNLQSQPPR